MPIQRTADRDIRVEKMIENMEQVIVGKRAIIELVITALLARGHILIEDVPGVGKTQLASALAHSCKGEFGRIQLTPDVMPSDITGFSMVNPATGGLEFKKGVVFCNFLLADEINRVSPKSQSALLEIMEEEQVSIDGQTYPMMQPFMVMATQNPVETYGTYHLPEAQMDRFLMKIHVGYPGREHELAILRRDKAVVADVLPPVLTCEDIMQMREEVEKVACAEAIEEYIIEIVETSRRVEQIRLGASPRASLALHHASKAYAFLSGRNYVLPDDVKYLAPYVLAHRLILSSRGKTMLGSEQRAVEELLKMVPVPVPHK